METSCHLYVDPVCPFAWIASRWIREVASLRDDLQVELRLMSIAVLNEGRELADWYREFNDDSWPTVRVAAAVDALGRYEEFYEAFGRRAHLDHRDDWDAVLVEVLAELGLPATLADSAPADPATVQALHDTHTRLNEMVGLETGTPTLVIDGVATFGPVLRAIPRGEHALALYDAMALLATVPALTEIKRGDDRPLDRR
jgi:predicted DsbA family dithiol-disulfide isomerase